MKYPNLELIEYISKQVLNVKDPSALYPTCTMYVFPQKGGGFSTVDDRYYAVFFDGRFAYMYLNPSEQFFKDLDKRFMKSQRGSRIYDEDYTGNE